MSSSPNLLIVDDSKESLLLLSTTIRKLNVNLIKAASASEALSKVREKRLALAIIDVRMPGVSGYELAVKLNETREPEKVPVIFLTANDYSEMELFKGYHSGAVDYLFKPFNPHILLSKIRVFLDLYDQKQKVIENTRLLQKSAEELIRANEALKKREEKLKQEQVVITSYSIHYTKLYDFGCRAPFQSLFVLIDSFFREAYRLWNSR